jgi:hypothetical protein
MRLLLALLLAVACSPSTSGAPDGSAPACVEVSGAGTTHGGSLTQAETWTASTSPHLLPSDTSISAAITLEPCAVVVVDADKTITVLAGGSIVARGTQAQPVTFRPGEAGQNWARIRTVGGTLSLTHTRLLEGGARLNAVLDTAAALDIRADQAKPPAEILHADGLLIQGSASQGILLSEGGAFSKTSTNLVIQGSAHYPIRAAAVLAGSIPDATLTGNGVDAIAILGTGLSAVRSDTTLHDRGVPYYVGDSLTEGRLDVAAAAPGTVARLTLEAGVQVRFKKGGGLFVQVAQNTSPATGALVAVGTQDRPIVLTSAEPTPAAGDWLGIYFNGVPDAASQLEFVRVEFAGGASDLVGSSCLYPGTPPKKNDAAIRVFAEPAASFIRETTVADSAGHGFDRGWLGASSLSLLADGNSVVRFARCKESFPTPVGSACPAPPPCAGP